MQTGMTESEAVELRKAELQADAELREASIQHARETLQADSRFLEQKFKADEKRDGRLFALAIVVVVASVAVAIAAMFSDNTAFVTEALKLLLTFAAGVVGGWGARGAKAMSQTD